MELFIDTTYGKIELIVISDGQVIGRFSEMSKNDHTIVLYRVYDKLKRELGIESGIFSRIYVVNGPGSFTGTRVGVIFAKTISQIYDIPIAPVNLLEILYITNKELPVAVDARGKSYYYYNGERIEIIPRSEIGEDTLMDPEILVENLVNGLERFPEVDRNDIDAVYLKSPI